MPTIVPGSPLIAIGEAPGKNEVEEGVGFVGASGKILDRALLSGGLERRRVSVSNVILCQPPDEGNFVEYVDGLKVAWRRAVKRWELDWVPREEALKANLSPDARHKLAVKRWEADCADRDEEARRPGPPPAPALPADCCRPRLERDVADANATVVLAVGGQALESVRNLLGLASTKERAVVSDDEVAPARVAPMKKQHGAPVLLPGGRVLMATYHPAFAMRDKPHYLDVIKDNVRRAAQLAVRGGGLLWRVPQLRLEPSILEIEQVCETFVQANASHRLGPGGVTVDIETDSVDPHVAVLRCIGMGAVVDGQEALICVPFRHMDGTPYWQDERDEARAFEAVSAVLRSCGLVFQNGNYDTTVLMRLGFMTEAERRRRWLDTLIAHKNSPDNDLPHDLGFIVRRFFDAPLWKEDVDHKQTGGSTDQELWRYNLLDVLGTMRVVEPLWETVVAAETLPQMETDTALLSVVRDMSELGLVVNEWQRGAFSLSLNKSCRELRNKFQTEVGRKINPRSTLQLRELFYGDWGYVPVVATDGYEFDPQADDVEDASTSNQALTRLQVDRIVDEKHAHFGAIETLLAFRAVDKLRGTYVDKLPTSSFEGDDVWGTAPGVRTWVYDSKLDKDVEVDVLFERPGLSLTRTTYKCHVTPTGRLASGDPVNVQNIPVAARGGLNLRHMLVAPPGHVIVGADYDQVEARLYAAVAQDRLLLKAIREKLDIHALNAASLFIEDGEDIMTRYEWVKKLPDIDKKHIRTVAKRFCIAEGQLVLTDQGLVPIEQVTTGHKVWDGVEWVAHDGVVFQGVKEVIEYDGLIATPDHEVWLEDGEKVAFGQAARQGRALARTGEAGEPLRFMDNDHRGVARTRSSQGDRALFLWTGEGCVSRQPNVRQIGLLPFLRYEEEPLGRRRDNARVGASSVHRSEEPLHLTRGCSMDQLRRSGYRVSVRIRGGGSGVDGQELWPTGQSQGTRPDQQRWPLRARESSLVVPPRKHSESALLEARNRRGVPSCGLEIHPGGVALQSELRIDETGQRNVARADIGGRTVRGNPQAAKLAPDRRTARTYDIVNAGPRRRFTVENRLASNCFALLYGADWPKVHSVMVAERSKSDGTRTFPNVTEKMCERWAENWHRLHPETREWHAHVHAQVKRDGYAASPLLDRRKRYFRDYMQDDNAMPNVTIQGSAAALANRALLAIDELIPHRGWSKYSGLIYQIHDYIGVVVPVDRWEEAKRIVEKCMFYSWNGMDFTATANPSWTLGQQ